MINKYILQVSRRRTSQEVRELKFLSSAGPIHYPRRTSQEVRELKSIQLAAMAASKGRTSQEVRELKCTKCVDNAPGMWSHLARGA